MRVQETKVYVAADGKEFATKEECKLYEDRDVFKPLLKMTDAHITAILAGEDEAKGKLLGRLFSKHVAALRDKGLRKQREKLTKEQRQANKLARAREILAEEEARTQSETKPEEHAEHNHGHEHGHEAHGF